MMAEMRESAEGLGGADERARPAARPLLGLASTLLLRHGRLAFAWPWGAWALEAMESESLGGPLAPWLQALGLGTYWDEFERVGCDTLDDLEEFTSPEAAPIEGLKYFDTRRLLRIKAQAKGSPGGNAAAAAESLVHRDGGAVAPPESAAAVVSRLHAQHGLLVCDAPHVRREDLAALQLPEAEHDATMQALQALGGPSAAVTAAAPTADDGQPDSGALQKTKSVPAQQEFVTWLSAIHLGGHAAAFTERGLDTLEDVGELRDHPSLADELGLKLFEGKRLLRAADADLSNTKEVRARPESQLSRGAGCLSGGEAE